MKNLVFIDIESSYSLDISSVCCISLVLVDSSTLKEIEKVTYYINSEMPYDNHGESAHVDIHINPEDISSAPNFEERYERLKKYLCDDYIVVGHAVESDIAMLNGVCARYNLERFHFNYFCSQMLYRLFHKDRTNKSLDKIVKEMGYENFSHHLCQDDVWMSYQTVKYVCKNLGMSLIETLDKYGIMCGENKRDYVSTTYSRLSKDSKKKQLEKIYHMDIPFVSAVKGIYGNVFAFNTKYEKKHTNEFKVLVAKIKEAGGQCTTMIKDATHYVDAYVNDDCSRRKFIENNLNLDIIIVDISQIKVLLDMR